MQSIINYLGDVEIQSGLYPVRPEFLDKNIEVLVQTKRTQMYESTKFKFRGKLYAMLYRKDYTHLNERELHIHSVVEEDFKNFWNYRANYLPASFTSEKSVAEIIGKELLRTSDNKEVRNLITLGFHRTSHEILSLKLEDIIIYQKPIRIL